jgi:hypothetical protein
VPEIPFTTKLQKFLLADNEKGVKRYAVFIEAAVNVIQYVVRVRLTNFGTAA